MGATAVVKNGHEPRAILLQPTLLVPAVVWLPPPAPWTASCRGPWRTQPVGGRMPSPARRSIAGSPPRCAAGRRTLAPSLKLAALGRAQGPSRRARTFLGKRALQLVRHSVKIQAPVGTTIGGPSILLLQCHARRCARCSTRSSGTSSPR